MVPLYFAAERPVVKRDGALIMVDDERLPLRPGERRAPSRALPHARLLPADRRHRIAGRHAGGGDHPEMVAARTSERQGRVIDHDPAASMEKKQEGTSDGP